MSKKFLKIPQGPDLGSFLVLGKDDWAAIESETGYELPQKVRELLALATLFLTSEVAQEKSAPRLDQKILKKLSSLSLQATKMRSELFPPHLWEKYQEQRYQKKLEVQLGLELEDIIDNPPVSPFAILRFSLGAIIGSCENVLKSIENMKGTGPADGRAYHTWIVLVTLIMKSNGLGYGASNSNRRATKSSPFVKLIMELQHLAIKKKTQSTDALAKAINRARKSVDEWPNIKNGEVESLVYNYAGATKSGGDEAHQWVVERVLEGQFAGLHPIIPETFIKLDLLKDRYRH